ncbi:hypothetical protein [Georgenia thermotolerans]|uniref:Uncharacterized protein n=1 Tax=Georgenia thermotolerans TaxID=527326 RepID=A0A7J5UKA8_9MICO|nr:hypothetical protein [Georgenia thermotolerans]KAE8762766.1 hypothetical protein GB883_17690 [Georgenia thermotolerans]
MDVEHGHGTGLPAGLSPARRQLLAALATLALAQAELAAAFPQAWRGTGADAYAQVLGGLLYHAQTVGAALRAADLTAAAADREQEAARGWAGPG